MVLVCLSTDFAHATDYTFAWSANPEPVEGYKLYYKKGGEAGPPYDGIDSLYGPSPIDIGKLTTFTISGLEDNTTYHFALTAYDGNDESGFSGNITVFPADNSSPDPTLEAVIITDSQEGEAPLTINFDAGSSSGTIDNYTWTFGDGDTASATTTSHIYQSAGTYTATLTVSDTSGSSQATNVVITATEPPPSLIQPTAVITSSSSVGDAPFTINFGGSESTTSQPPFTSYSWNFNDGATAEGVSVSHTYTSAGTYNPSLTVYDSAGLSDQVTTPVIINPTPEPTPNQPPTSSFTATPGYGAPPLIVTFDGSGSSDADGSIKSYAWSFGDGTSATGSSTQHTYTDIGEYTVTLKVTDNMNETAVSSQVVSVIEEDGIEFNFELQEIEIDHNWTRFDFTQPFVDPVVVAGPPSFNGGQPATVRIRNIDASGCEIRIQEWDYLDGWHVPETLTFLVMERGAYTTGNGSKIEAGTFTGTTSFQKIELLQTYTNTPVILSQIMTENETDAVTGRIHSTNTSSFEYKMQEQELTPTAHVNETTGYIAWEPGTGEFMGLTYEAGFTPRKVVHKWYNIIFQTNFPDLPLLIAGMQTYYGSETAAIRSQNPSTNSIQVKIEEEASKDKETKHRTEVVGYLIIGTEVSTEETNTP
jgi:PKD repeat protein